MQLNALIMLAQQPFIALRSRGAGQQFPVGTHIVPVRGIVVAVLVVLLLATLPTWPYSRRWGYLPISIIALVLVLVVALILFGVF
jgi:hypothetical protein